MALPYPTKKRGYYLQQVTRQDPNVPVSSDQSNAQIPPHIFWLILTAVVGLGLGVFANPWIITTTQMIHVLLILEGIVGIGWLAYEFGRAYHRLKGEQQTPGYSPLGPPPPRLPSLPCSIALVTLFAQWCWLFRTRWQVPKIIGDDSHYLNVATNWHVTWNSLLVPYNEHLVVPTRIVTYVLVALFGEEPAGAMAAIAIVLFALTVLQLFVLSRLLFCSESAAVTVVALFAITSCYREIILWYSATQWLITFNVLLTALILVSPANRGVPIAKRRILAATFLCFLAPFSFSLGLLVGPIVVCWLFVRRDLGLGFKRVAWMLAPVAGTFLSLSITVPILSRWMQTEQYLQEGGRGAVASFSLFHGIANSVRLFIDLQILEAIGIQIADPGIAPVFLFPIVIVLIAMLVRRHPLAWNLLPALFCVVLAYGVTMPFRAWVQYPNLLQWTRYQLVPRFGVSLFTAGALTLMCPRCFAGDEKGQMTWTQCLILVAAGQLLASLNQPGIR